MSVLLLSAAALCTSSPLSAQEPRGAYEQKPADFGVEVFGGYSGYRAGGAVDGVRVPDFKFGWAGQLILNTSHWAGLVADVGGHYNAFASAHDLAFGPHLQLPLGHFNPFMDALVGVQHLSPKSFPSQNTATYILGVGMDVKVNSAFSIRPFQLSYIHTDYSVMPTSGEQHNYLNGYIVQAGLIYILKRSSSEGEVIASCSAEPAAVDPGVKVEIGVTLKGRLPRRTLRYSYATTGGAISGSGATESVDTTGVGPGAYTVTARVVDKGRSKHQKTASCQAKFSVNAKQTPPPPVDARQTPPAPPVAAEQDSRKPGGASATTDAVQTPVKANAPTPSRFGIVRFNRDLKRPTRVDNEAKGELDRYADALAASPDATGVVVAYGGAKDGKDSKNVLSVASQRAVNTKDYLAKEKGIDPGRIQPRTGSGDGQTTELWILPAGATFAAPGTTVVDESKVKAIPRIALKARNAHKHRHTHKRLHRHLHKKLRRHAHKKLYRHTHKKLHRHAHRRPHKHVNRNVLRKFRKVRHHRRRRLAGHSAGLR